MNDPSKRIDVSKSSLLSLKAELLRKKEEASKSSTNQSLNTFVPKKLTKISRNDNKKESSVKEKKDFTETEDSMLLLKSKKMLEAKGKFYDRMVSSGGKLNSDENCLVMFNQKKQTSKYVDDSSDSSDDDRNNSYDAENDGDEWVDYTDCFGRTRKCLRKDLDFYKKKDDFTAENIQPTDKFYVDKVGEEVVVEEPQRIVEENIVDESNETTLKLLKEQWEKREVENTGKDFVHYQDVLFDEARTHGVGYYEFSTDEVERAKQRKELDSIREATVLEQKKRMDQKQTRDKMIADRVKAARNRQRARLGLPPEEDDSDKQMTDDLYDKTQEEERKKKEEELKLEKQLDDKIKDNERKRHVRPWDEGKSKNLENWTPFVEKEPMSQEQWNTKKRSERLNEFAPVYESEPENEFKFIPEPSAPGTDDFKYYEEENKNLFFSSKKRVTKNVESYSNPIVNELSNSGGDSDGVDDDDEERSGPKRAEIPPPPTFDYYGPTSSGFSKREKRPKPNIENSIEAGLKFLRNQSDKGQFGTKQKWTTNKDY